MGLGWATEMAKNLKKFVNPKFTRTVDLGLLSRLFERHRDALKGLTLGSSRTGQRRTMPAARSRISSPDRKITIRKGSSQTCTA